MANKKDYSFGIIPINRDGDTTSVLLVKGRSSTTWSFPKGHMEAGESELETARREFGEETGITQLEISPEHYFFEYYTIRKKGIWYDKTVKFFVGLLDKHEPVIQTHEIGDCRWFSLDEALEIIYGDQNKSNLTSAIKLLH